MTVAVAIADPSYVATARRETETLARKLGLGDADVARTALIATELATNVARHGRGGQLLLQPLPASSVTGIELVAIDRGTGIANIPLSLSDGISTAGTSGTGLGAIRRQADEFDIASGPGQGTAVMARIWPNRTPVAAVGVQVGAVSVAKPEEQVCGDAWGVQAGSGKFFALVADGLGHGPLAAMASGEARRLFMGSVAATPIAMVQRLHAGLQATRGAAIGVVSLDLDSSRAVFAGIGNIAGLVMAGGNTRRFVSMNGIAGHAAERFQEFVYPCDGEGLVLILHSDGLSTNWSLDRYAGLLARHPSLIAAVLYRDAGRGRDDATVLVLKRAA